mmetsp:Transcript_26239/g.42887  ORF Transcript_26239/g.42887 Transcript_26239/m.42887 type:complete len:497 (+) Transcript_26239:24-1514(+)
MMSSCSKAVIAALSVVHYVSAQGMDISTTVLEADDDVLSQIDGEMGVMDWIWTVYALFALIASLLCICKCGVNASCFYWCQDETYDAISEKCYAEIITARGYDATQKGFGDNRELSLMVLRADLKEKIVWHNDWKKDFALFIRNEHALFSMCFAHRAHPFSRRDRRLILLSSLLLDFGFAIAITFLMAFVSTSDNVDFVLDFLISYIFGILMSTLESLLVGFAVCAAAEKCPTCFRQCCKLCSTGVMGLTLLWGVLGFGIGLVFVISTSLQDDKGVFWSLFVINFFVGLIQAWLLIDLIKMALQFRSAWKEAHPPPRPTDEAEIARQSAMRKWGARAFCCCCFPLYLVWQCCCTSRKKTDPYDDGQDDFGINFHEYLAWKQGQDIGERKLPHSYQMAGGEALTNAAKNATKNAQNAYNQQVNAAQQKVDGATKELTDYAKKTEMKSKELGSKWKQKAQQKAMGMQMKLGGKKKAAESVDDDAVDAGEDVELVVDQK